jgi:hypothetical protein
MVRNENRDFELFNNIAFNETNVDFIALNNYGMILLSRVATAVGDKNQSKYVKLVIFSQSFCTIIR